MGSGAANVSGQSLARAVDSRHVASRDTVQAKVQLMEAPRREAQLRLADTKAEARYVLAGCYQLASTSALPAFLPERIALDSIVQPGRDRSTWYRARSLDANSASTGDVSAGPGLLWRPLPRQMDADLWSVVVSQRQGGREVATSVLLADTRAGTAAGVDVLEQKPRDVVSLRTPIARRVACPR
jgi:hypothetical protein